MNRTKKDILEPILQNEDQIKKVKKKIKEYVDMLDKSIPVPDGGDCWYCAFMDKKGEQYDHIYAHVGGKYMHGSIVVNAMREAGYRDEQIGFHYQMRFIDTFKRALRKYLNKRLVSNFDARLARLHKLI